MRMKLPLSLILLCLAGSVVYGQFHVRGQLQSTIYAFDTPLVEQANFYQGLRLRINHEQAQSSYLNTFFRVAKQGDNSWDDRLYNLYGNYGRSHDHLQIRLGRQFLYEGVISGTLDGVLVTLRPVKKLTLRAFGGFEAPFSREFRVVGSDSNAVGAYVSYRPGKAAKLDVSYFQRRRNDASVWQVAGAALNGNLLDNAYYHVDVRHNLQSEKLQGIRLRLNYYAGALALNGEFNRQRPRVQEDSYFRIFKIAAFSQFRGGVNYTLGEVQLGLQYLFTDFYIEQGNQVILNSATEWGYIGVVFQNGYGGENIGIFGDVRYDLFSTLTIKLFSSYYNYERQTTDISEEATAFSAGVIYQPFEPLSIQAELQESINSAYDNDLRGLFRLSYSFRK